MLKGLEDIVTIAWNGHMTDKPLSRILVYIALLVFMAITCTTILAFIFLGISGTAAVTLIVLSSGAMVLCVYFWKDFFVSRIFTNWNHSKKTDSKPDTDTVQEASCKDGEKFVNGGNVKS